MEEQLNKLFSSFMEKQEKQRQQELKQFLEQQEQLRQQEKLQVYVFEWENIGYTIKEKRKGFFNSQEINKTILHEVSGSVTSNKTIAVLGPSGSGKSTFLTALACRLKGKSGIIRINSSPISDNDFRRISGFIHQDDIFTESLTVHEHMQFMTALKLSLPDNEREIRIVDLLADLCLTGSTNTVIRMLSGGERRRLSLATELISNPLILFCDEITTGLDSSSAMTVVRCLETVAKLGKIVMTVVHQPSSQLYSLFSDIILLANGKLIFKGSSNEAINFFERANLFCPVSFNPADFYIKCLTIYPNSEDQDQERINMLASLFSKTNRPNIYNSPKLEYSSILKWRQAKRRKLYQLRWLLWRTFIDFRRNTANFKANFSTAMITALLICIVFNNTGERDVQNIQGAFSLIVAELIFNQMYYVLYLFPEEFIVFSNEKSLYDTFPYYLSKIISVIPVVFISAFSLVTTYCIGLGYLQKLSFIFRMWYFFCAACLGGISLGLCLSAFVMDFEYAALIIVPLQLMLMVVSGLWIKLSSMPLWLKVVKYFSPFFLIFEGISVAYWENINIGNCTDDQHYCYKNGREVLERYDLIENYNVSSMNIIISFVLMTFYFLMGYIGISLRR